MAEVDNGQHLVLLSSIVKIYCPDPLFRRADQAAPGQRFSAGLLKKITQ